VANAEDLLFTPSKLEKSIVYPMKSGKCYAVELQVRDQKSPKIKPNEPGAYSSALCFQEEHSSEKAIAAAAKSAADSDVAIVFAGRNAEHECEGSDLVDINIPGDQVQMIQAVAAESKKTVVVLFGGGALDVSPFVDSVDAIVYAHYLGQEGGAAIADVLSGKTNPSGKLPMTWPRRLEDVSTFKHFPAVPDSDGTITLPLNEGLEVGYRRDWAWVAGGPQYLFGYGLSYTSFSVRNLDLRPSTVDFAGGKAQITVRLTLANTGPVAGAEVVQVYVAPSSKSSSVNSSEAMHPIKALKGFKKVTLKAGEATEVEIVLDAKRALSFWNTATSKWRVAKGVYTISIGIGADALSQDLAVAEDLEWLHL
jgi:beta-glucosidase